MPPRLVNLMNSSYISLVYWPTKFIRKKTNKDGCQEQKGSGAVGARPDYIVSTYESQAHIHMSWTKE